MEYFDCAFAHIAGRFKRGRDPLGRAGLAARSSLRCGHPLVLAVSRAGWACQPAPDAAAARGGGVGRRRGPPDEFYGNHRGLRRELQARTLGYVLGVASNHRLTLATGLSATAQHIADRHLPRRSWNRLSAGKGHKGERDYDWPSYASSRPPTRPPATTGC
jgi:hypothetical protein